MTNTHPGWPDNYVRDLKTCPFCGGTGSVQNPETGMVEDCEYCEASGYVL